MVPILCVGEGHAARVVDFTLLSTLVRSKSVHTVFAWFWDSNGRNLILASHLSLFRFGYNYFGWEVFMGTGLIADVHHGVQGRGMSCIRQPIPTLLLLLLFSQPLPLR